jgi:hypothetical protein
MSLVVVPEIILLEVINKGIAFVRKDYEDASDKTKSWLNIAFNGVVIERYDLLKEIVAMVCTPIDHPRYFEGDLMFNPKKNKVPAFHIQMPAETPSDGNSIGMGQDSATEIYNDTVQDAEIVSTDVREVFSRRIQTNYNVVVVSDNPMETVVLYHFLKAILMASVLELVTNGLEQITFAGQDIQPYRELDHQFYMRAVSLGLQYTSSVPSMVTFTFPNDVTVDGKPIGD